jgi:glycosyltransferase involved in cell wall biosynthesis
MERAPRVSVLMTAYNREPYIAQAIESVLASTLSDLELIVVDDNSKDGTLAIAEGYRIRDPRVRVHRNAANLGDYPNRNHAASLAAGRYLKYVDSDDYIYPHGLGVMVSAMESFPEAALGLAAQPPRRDRPFPVLLSPNEAFRSHYFEGSGILSRAPLSAIIRADVFRSVGGFPPARMVGDFAMWHRIAAEHPVLLLPQGLTWYRVHDAQEVNDMTRRPLTYRYAYERVIVDSVQSLRIAGTLSTSEADSILRSISRGRLRDAVRGLLRLRLAESLELLRASLSLQRHNAFLDEGKAP